MSLSPNKITNDIYLSNVNMHSQTIKYCLPHQGRMPDVGCMINLGDSRQWLHSGRVGVLRVLALRHRTLSLSVQSTSSRFHALDSPTALTLRASPIMSSLRILVPVKRVIDYAVSIPLPQRAAGDRSTCTCTPNSSPRPTHKPSPARENSS